MAAGLRRAYSDAVKKKAVERLFAGRTTIQEYAEEKDVAESVVRRWTRDPRYGGKPGAFARKSNGSVENGIGLPTKKRRGGAARIRAAIPTQYKCPHCGGPIRIGEDAT